jgi:hypothetical protein
MSRADLALGADLIGRRFKYLNGIARHSYLSFTVPGPAASFSGEVFPLPPSARTWSDVGLFADCTKIFLPGSVNPISYTAGLLVRVHPGDEPPVIVDGSVAYAFTGFDAVGPSTAKLPEVAYRELRVGVDARLPLGRWSLLGGGALRVMLDPLGISSGFYDPSGLGLDVHLGGAWTVTGALEVRLLASYERDWFSFHAAGFTSGNALDERYAGRLALAYVIP